MTGNCVMKLTGLFRPRLSGRVATPSYCTVEYHFKTNFLGKEFLGRYQQMKNYLQFTCENAWKPMGMGEAKNLLQL